MIDSPGAPSPTADNPDAQGPGLVARLRGRYPWLDHLMRAYQRYTDSKGNFYAAGLTYYTIFAMFPLLMVAFATGGFVLSRRPDLMTQIEDRIRRSVSVPFSDQVIDMVDMAIRSRTSVGLIGLGIAVWAGLNWMDNLREALSQMWERRGEPAGFLRTKLSDLLAMISLFVAALITVALTAAGDAKLTRKMLAWLHVPDFGWLSALLRLLSVLVAVLVSWLLFTWIIARLPRESIELASAARAGLFVAVAFEVLKQVGSAYLQSVVTGPTGAVFGPVLGLMVFAYLTARIVLLGTAWAATAGAPSTDPVADSGR